MSYDFGGSESDADDMSMAELSDEDLAMSPLHPETATTRPAAQNQPDDGGIDTPQALGAAAVDVPASDEGFELSDVVLAAEAEGAAMTEGERAGRIKPKRQGRPRAVVQMDVTDSGSDRPGADYSGQSGGVAPGMPALSPGQSSLQRRKSIVHGGSATPTFEEFQDDVEGFVEDDGGDDDMQFRDADSPDIEAARARQRKTSTFHRGSVVSNTNDDPNYSSSGSATPELIEDDSQITGISHQPSTIEVTYDTTKLGMALLNVRVSKRKASGAWAPVWRETFRRVRLQVLAAHIVKEFREAAKRRAVREGFAIGERRTRELLEQRCQLEMLHLMSLSEGLAFREAYEFSTILDLRQRRAPTIGRHETGTMAVDVSCRRSLHDGTNKSLTEGGAYCKVRRGEYIDRAGRETTEMFDFDVGFEDASNPMTVEVWASDPHGGADSIVGAFQLQPAGMPRSGRGNVSLTLSWDWRAGVQPGHVLSKRERERYHGTLQYQRELLLREYRDASSRLFDRERYAWRAIVEAFALEERLFEANDKRRVTQQAETLLLEEAQRRRRILWDFRSDRLQLEQDIYRRLLEATESWSRSATMDALLRHIDRGEARFERDFRRRHGVARQGTVALLEGEMDAMTSSLPSPTNGSMNRSGSSAAFSQGEPMSPPARLVRAGSRHPHDAGGSVLAPSRAAMRTPASFVLQRALSEARTDVARLQRGGGGAAIDPTSPLAATTSKLQRSTDADGQTSVVIEPRRRVSMRRRASQAAALGGSNTEVCSPTMGRTRARSHGPPGRPLPADASLPPIVRESRRPVAPAFEAAEEVSDDDQGDSAASPVLVNSSRPPSLPPIQKSAPSPPPAPPLQPPPLPAGGRTSSPRQLHLDGPIANRSATDGAAADPTPTLALDAIMLSYAARAADSGRYDAACGDDFASPLVRESTLGAPAAAASSGGTSPGREQELAVTASSPAARRPSAGYPAPSPQPPTGPRPDGGHSRTVSPSTTPGRQRGSLPAHRVVSLLSRLDE